MNKYYKEEDWQEDDSELEPFPIECQENKTEDHPEPKKRKYKKIIFCTRFYGFDLPRVPLVLTGSRLYGDG